MLMVPVYGDFRQYCLGSLIVSFIPEIYNTAVVSITDKGCDKLCKVPSFASVKSREKEIKVEVIMRR